MLSSWAGGLLRFHLNETVRTLVGLYVPSALVSFGQGMLVPITPALASEFDVPLGLAAQVFGANLLGRLVLMIPAGYLVDRYGSRSAMISGPIIIVACAVITLITPNFWLLLTAQFIAGGGSGLWQLGRELIAVDLVSAGARGRVMSIFIGVSTAGVAIGPLLGGFINDIIGYRGVFAVALGMAIVVMLISFAVAGEGKAIERVAQPSWSLGGISEIDPMFRATYLALIFCTLAATLRQTVSTAMLPLYAGSELGYSSTEIGILFGIMGFTNLAVLGIAGWVSDEWGRKAAVVPAAALGAIGFLIFPLSSNFMVLAVNCVLMGVASGFAMGSMTIYTYDIVPPQARGRLQSLRRVVGQTSGTLGPIIGGVIASVTSPSVVFLVFAPFLVASALLVGLVARESAGKRVASEG
ncbi:MAG: MFS transporter [Chloroflexota bacterium]